MNAQDLKNSILQLAVQGKLVEQRPEEGTAKELLEQIKAEKEKLVKEKKIKKEKPLPEISEGEIPFEIPESWEWVHLSDIVDMIMGQSPKGNDVMEGGSGIEFHQGKVYFGTDYINKSSQTTMNPTKIVKPNTVLLCVRAPVGVVNITERTICIGRGLCGLIGYGEIESRFLLHWLRAFKNDFIRKATGTTFIAITGEVVKSQVIPLPPLAEQHRIVAKIEEILPYIDQYDKAYTKLEIFNKKFPEDMKKSILQLAMQGKLVEQRPEEGTADELCKQIVVEKAQLIKDGKIKKEKPLPEITEDEIPFEIPSSWKWVRLGTIVSVYGGKRIPAGTRLSEEDTGHKYIRVADMKDGTVSLEDIKYITDEIFQKIKQYYITSDDIYITVAGTIGKVGIVPDELNNANLTENADKLVFSNLDKMFLCRTLNSEVIQHQIREATTQVGQPKLAIARIQKLLIPLPPLAEQKRIVAKIEELLPYCDQLVK